MTGVCIVAGCPDPVHYRGRCRDHARRDRLAVRAGSPLYNSKRWRILRRRVLFDNPLCSCGELAAAVDHIVPLADGGAPFARDNLRPLCSACHGRKTRAERVGRVAGMTSGRSKDRRVTRRTHTKGIRDEQKQAG
jgi:5-methylcytosine-specific restriction enzyme A